jgi:two-component system, OmpR family, response regulator VicR
MADTSKKIMIVDDDAALGQMYQQIFTDEGYEVVWVQDGEQALAKILEEKPNLLLLDIMMPKIQGLDVLDIIKATPSTEQTKIMILTALSDENVVAKAKQFGAVDVIVKSQVEMADVVAKVKAVLGD